MGHVRCAIESLHHRHNVSAVLRTCDALGLYTVHLVGVDAFTPSRGACRGADRWLDVRTQPTPAETIAQLREEGCALWVADLTPDAVPPEAVPLDRPVCLWFGAEMVGVGPEARAAADGVVSLPMRGMAQSLNVSVAAALALHSVAERARRELGEQALLPRAQREALIETWLARDGVEAAALAAADLLSELQGS